MKGRSIKDNLHLVREILEGIKDDTEGALINLDQSKAFDRMDHRFLVTVFGDCRIRTGVPQMAQHDVPQPAGGGAGERKAFEGFCDRPIGPARSPLLYVHALERLLRRLRDEGACLALRGVSLTGRSERGFPRTLMTLRSLCPADWAYWQ